MVTGELRSLVLLLVVSNLEVWKPKLKCVLFEFEGVYGSFYDFGAVFGLEIEALGCAHYVVISGFGAEFEMRLFGLFGHYFLFL